MPSAYDVSRGEGGGERRRRLIGAGRLQTYLAIRVGAYWRWALIEGGLLLEVGCLSEVGVY